MQGRERKWKNGERAYSVAVSMDELFLSSSAAVKPEIQNLLDKGLRSRIVAIHFEGAANAALMFAASLDDARLIKSEFEKIGVHCGKNISSGVLNGDKICMDDVQTMKRYNQS